jgi:hypothetical protein
MKKLIPLFVLILLLSFMSVVKAGFNPLPETCGPAVIDGVKMYYCQPGTVLTAEQQAKIDRINASIRANQEKNEVKLQAIQETKLNRVQEREENRASVAAKLTETHRNRIRGLYGVLSNRLQAAVERLDTLIQRIQSRIDQLSAEGVDVVIIQNQLDEAEILLDEANANLQAVNTSFEDVLNSDDPKEAFVIMKDELTSVKNDLIEVHKLLVDIIDDIKGLRIGTIEE